MRSGQEEQDALVGSKMSYAATEGITQEPVVMAGESEAEQVRVHCIVRPPFVCWTSRTADRMLEAGPPPLSVRREMEWKAASKEAVHGN